MLEIKVTLAEGTNLIKRKVRYFISKLNKIEVVKEGVDILTMNCEREPHDTESSLELILNTLCRAF